MIYEIKTYQAVTYLELVTITVEADSPDEAMEKAVADTDLIDWHTEETLDVVTTQPVEIQEWKIIKEVIE